MNLRISSDNIFYTCDDFLLLNKPPGISVQCQPDSPGCIAELKQLLGLDHLHPVHRLDKGTSGLLLVAKNAEANRGLSQLFQSRLIDKYYFAVSAKKPSKKQGKVIGDMSPSRNGAWKLTRERCNPAISYFFSKGLGDGHRLFIIKPLTGKTHQIRVALKSLGAPIIGDERYGAKPSDRLYLHATALAFNYKNQKFHFYALPQNGKLFASDATQNFLCSLDPPDQLDWPAKPKDEQFDNSN